MKLKVYMMFSCKQNIQKRREIHKTLDKNLYRTFNCKYLNEERKYS